MKINLTRKIPLFFVTGLLFINSCEKEVIILDERSVLKGFMYSFDEFCTETNDRDSILIKIRDTEYTAVTDSNGGFVFEDIPIGKYTVEFNKKGYISGSYPCEITGIKDTVDFSYRIPKISNTLITNLSIELDGYNLYALGTITHRSPITDFSEYTPDDWNTLFPYFEIFCSTDSNVSRENYYKWEKGITTVRVYRSSYPVLVPSGETFRIRMYWTIPAPGAGETFYYIAYGGNFFCSESDQPSNVFSLTGK